MTAIEGARIYVDGREMSFLHDITFGPRARVMPATVPTGYGYDVDVTIPIDADAFEAFVSAILRPWRRRVRRLARGRKKCRNLHRGRR